MNNRLALSSSALASILLFVSCGAQGTDLGEITVTGTREETPKAETPASVGAVGGEAIDDIRPGHPAEVMGRIPGVQVSVTGGEGHTTGIRQPIDTSPVYLYLEDGIPTRSTGFFNHNALYEVNIPQAGGIEVTKGPGSSLYGSDAIGGVINVLTKPAPEQAEVQLNVEAGEFGWARLLAGGGNSWDSDGVRADLNLTHTDGWRDGTEYDRQSGTLRWDRFLEGGASLKTVMSASKIDQQTAGSSTISEEDYKNDPTANYTPISYRDVTAFRLSTAYEKEDGNSLWSVTPYVRHNVMEYMPNWSFTYDPNITETSNDSLGLLLKYRRDFAPMRTRLVVGADIDHSPGSRLEHSIDAVKEGDIYTSYTVAEKIYDYDVTFQGVSPYAHLEFSPAERLRMNAGLRYDSVSYDYDNHMSDEQTVVDPTSTRFPVRYNHPADTQVDYSHLSPKLGLTYALTPNLNGFLSYRHAFRAPSEGQLFRPGKAINTTELDPVKVDSYEVGVRGRAGRLDYELSVYSMTKKDDIVTFEHDDGTREVMNAGETLHRGIELGVGAAVTDTLNLSLAYSYAKHTYEEWREDTTGTDFSGNEMAVAPREVGNARLSWRPAVLQGGRVELEWERLGSYWMDDANTAKYDGHDLWNLRGNYPAGKLEIYGRVMNLTDERYATRTKLSSSGDEEFAPGLPRTVYAGVNYNF